MKKKLWLIPLLAFGINAAAAAAEQVRDLSSHTVRFVAVDKEVKLEVLDWGGRGSPLVFLAGLGNTAHVYDNFAPKFTGHHHVYGITRRGFGASSAPIPANDNYSADRLGDDVLAVIDTLHLEHPVIVGHSIAGEELSSIGSRHPERIAGLIYLDAGYGYAFYDRAHGDPSIDMHDLEKRFDAIRSGVQPFDKETTEDLLDHVLQLATDLRHRLAFVPPRSKMPKEAPDVSIGKAIGDGMQIFTEIRTPILAIFAIPGANVKASEAKDAWQAGIIQRADAFEAGLPAAHVVRIPNADHFVFKSNEAAVIKEMNAFLATLPAQ